MWNLMAREIQQAGSHLHPVRYPEQPISDDSLTSIQVENARAAMDLYRSYNEPWEAAIQKGNWPCILPPSTFSRCYT